jgi:hypothetical protein
MSKRRLLAAILIRLRVNSDAASGRPTSLNSGMTCVCRDAIVSGCAAVSPQVLEVSICPCRFECQIEYDTATHQIFKYAGQQEDQTKRQLDAGPPIVQPLSKESAKGSGHDQSRMHWCVKCTAAADNTSRWMSSCLISTSQMSPRNSQKGRGSSFVMKYGRPATGDPSTSFSAA